MRNGRVVVGAVVLLLHAACGGDGSGGSSSSSTGGGSGSSGGSSSSSSGGGYVVAGTVEGWTRGADQAIEAHVCGPADAGSNCQVLSSSPISAAGAFSLAIPAPGAALLGTLDLKMEAGCTGNLGITPSNARGVGVDFQVRQGSNVVGQLRRQNMNPAAASAPATGNRMAFFMFAETAATASGTESCYSGMATVTFSSVAFPVGWSPAYYEYTQVTAALPPSASVAVHSGETADLKWYFAAP